MNYSLLLEKYRVEMLTKLNELLSIPSVYDEKTVTKNQPFGKEVHSALQYVAKLGEGLGFKVDCCDGYATELTIGEGEKLISIFAHSDVVPASGNWTNDPFKPTLIDGKLFARGTSDDKGPLIAALYATKALADNGLISGYRVRLVVGGDEERGSGCLHHYFEVLKKEQPTYGFTPDSDFPLIYGEKQIVDFYPEIAVKLPEIKKIYGGVATNAVCDKVVVEMKKNEDFINYLKEHQIEFEIAEDKIIFYGKSCHGSTPQLGVNAALICLSSIGEYFNVPTLSKIGVELSETSGKKFNGFYHSKLLGDTTYCLGMINYENSKLKFTINFRSGENVNLKTIVNNFDEHFGSKSEMKEPSPYLLFDPKCKLVKTLLKAYRKETHDYSKPLTTGGGTYAKHAPNTLAFGALFPNRESRMHEPDEYISLDDFYLSSVIYARAINLLGKLK